MKRLRGTSTLSRVGSTGLHAGGMVQQHVAVPHDHAVHRHRDS